MIFHWSLSDSKSPQVSRTLLSILAVLNNAVVCLLFVVSTRLPTSKSNSPFSNHLVTVPNAPITIGIVVTCIFRSFFNSLARSRFFFLLLLLFGFFTSALADCLSMESSWQQISYGLSDSSEYSSGS